MWRSLAGFSSSIIEHCNVEKEKQAFYSKRRKDILKRRCRRPGGAVLFFMVYFCLAAVISAAQDWITGCRVITAQRLHECVGCQPVTELASQRPGWAEPSRWNLAPTIGGRWNNGRTNQRLVRQLASSRRFESRPAEAERSTSRAAVFQTSMKKAFFFFNMKHPWKTRFSNVHE